MSVGYFLKISVQNEINRYNVLLKIILWHCLGIWQLEGITDGDKFEKWYIYNELGLMYNNSTSRMFVYPSSGQKILLHKDESEITSFVNEMKKKKKKNMQSYTEILFLK